MANVFRAASGPRNHQGGTGRDAFRKALHSRHHPEVQSVGPFGPIQIGVTALGDPPDNDQGISGLHRFRLIRSMLRSFDTKFRIGDDSRVSSVEETKAISADPAAAWKVLADFGSLSSWVPMIQHSCLISEQDQGVGTARRVRIAQQTLVERVEVWEPTSTLGYTIEGLPPMVGATRNTWRLIPTDAGTDVRLTTEIETGRNPIRKAIANKVFERMSMASKFMLAGLATATSQLDKEVAS